MRQPLFQCSSASRKFLKIRAPRARAVGVSFSALQRAENFSIPSRRGRLADESRFSALQRAENFSIVLRALLMIVLNGFSALQRAENFSTRAISRDRFRDLVSVLFSEPKISQSDGTGGYGIRKPCFSALQRAENFSIAIHAHLEELLMGFSALQRAENFSSWATWRGVKRRTVSVLFSEPKISQYRSEHQPRDSASGFSALQRAENFSIALEEVRSIFPRGFSALQRAENFSIARNARVRCVLRVSVLFSEPKISQSKSARS